MELTLSLSATLATKAKQRFEIPMAFKNPPCSLPHSPSTALLYSYTCYSLPCALSATMSTTVWTLDKQYVDVPKTVATLSARYSESKQRYVCELSSSQLNLVRRFNVQTRVN